MEIDRHEIVPPHSRTCRRSPESLAGGWVHVGRCTDLSLSLAIVLLHLHAQAKTRRRVESKRSCTDTATRLDTHPPPCFFCPLDRKLPQSSLFSSFLPLLLLFLVLVCHVPIRDTLPASATRREEEEEAPSTTERKTLTEEREQGKERKKS